MHARLLANSRAPSCMLMLCVHEHTHTHINKQAKLHTYQSTDTQYLLLHQPRITCRKLATFTPRHSTHRNNQISSYILQDIRTPCQRTSILQTGHCSYLQHSLLRCSRIPFRGTRALHTVTCTPPQLTILRTGVCGSRAMPINMGTSAINILCIPGIFLAMPGIPLFNQVMHCHIITWVIKGTIARHCILTLSPF